MALEAPKITLDAPTFDLKHLMLRRKLVWSIGLFLASIVFFGLLGLWFWPQASQTQTDLVKTRQSLLAATQRSNVLTGIKPEDQQNFLRVAQTLPASKEPLVVLQALTDISREVSINLSQYDTNPGLISTGSAVANRSSKGSRVQLLQVAVEMSGTFEQIKQALELLESAAPIMEVTELSLSPNNQQGAEPGNTVYRAKLQLTSYFLPPTVGGAGSSVAKVLTPQQQATFESIRLWRNRLPEQVLAPEIYSRTNLFQIEVINPDVLPEQIQETVEDTTPAVEGSEEAQINSVETQP